MVKEVLKRVTSTDGNEECSDGDKNECSEDSNDGNDDGNDDSNDDGNDDGNVDGNDESDG